MIFIQSDLSSPAAANTQVLFDVRDERISSNVYGDLSGVIAMPSGFLADRYYYGWWGKDTPNGAVAFEWRLDDAPEPEWTYRSILTAVRTRIGYPILHSQLPNPHAGQPSIWRWYRQQGRDIWTRGGFEIMLMQGRDPNHHPQAVELYSRNYLASGETDTQFVINGPALAIPKNITRHLWVRGEVARKPGTGSAVGGLGQVTYAPWPLPAWDPSTHPNFGLAAKGHAGYEPPGYVHTQQGLPIWHNPGTGKLIAFIEANTLATLIIEGYRISPHILHVDPPPPPPGNEIRGNVAAHAAYNMIGEDAGSGGVGRRHAGLRFANDVTGSVVNAKLDVVQMHQPSSYIAAVYADNAGSPGAQIGGNSDALSIATAGVQTFTWSAGAPALTPGNYWIVASDVGGTGLMRVSLSVDQGSAYGSGDDDTITSIADEYSYDYRFTVEIEPD